MKDITTQIRLKILSELFDEIADLIDYPRIKIEYVSGTNFNNCIINARLTEGQLSTILASEEFGMRLREFIYDFLGIYCQSIITSSVDSVFANRIFKMLSNYFQKLDIKEFYIPVFISKTNEKYDSQFVQYAIVNVPPELWGDGIVQGMTEKLQTKKAVFVQNEEYKSYFLDDPYTAYIEYITVLTRCIAFGQLNEIVTSD